MAKTAQIPMQFSRRGGARPGAGRKKGKDRGASHAKRPEFAKPRALHVTVPVLEHVWNLRTRRCFAIVSAAFVAAAGRFGLRVVALGVQGNHLHLLVEAATSVALSLGTQGLAIRLAKGLNRRMGSKGRVLRERFHCRVLRTPAEVRAVFAYIAGNTRKHASQAGRHLPATYRDPYAVGWFGSRVLLPEGAAGMVCEPETWLLRDGWRRTAAPERPARARRRAGRVSASAVLPLPGLGGGALTDRPEDPGPPLEGEHRDRSADAAVVMAAAA